MRDSNETVWWRWTSILAGGAIGGLGLVVACIAGLAALAPGATFLGGSFATFFGAVLAPLLIVIGAFVFASRQQAVDRRHDVAEE
jgi:uncharacterized membrane protein